MSIYWPSLPSATVAYRYVRDTRLQLAKDYAADVRARKPQMQVKRQTRDAFFDEQMQYSDKHPYAHDLS